MTITQTVDIPADRHLRFEYDVPHEVLADKAQVIIEFPVRGKPKADDNGIPRITRKQIREMRKDCPITQSLSGILSGMGDVDLDEWRMKRLAKHL
jgi:hypothetical protein